MRASGANRQYDARRLRVRPAPEHWSGEAPRAVSDAEVECNEQDLVTLLCEELHWTLEAEHRAARLRELQCARRLQQTLHLAERTLQADVDCDEPADAAGQLALVRRLHVRAVRETRRLAELEDEWTIMRGDPTCVRAVNARHRADLAARRCSDLRELLRRVPLEVEREVVQAQQAYEELVRSSAVVAEAEMVAAAEDDLDLISLHVANLSSGAEDTQALLTELTNLEREREAEIERRYQASDRRLLAEGERLRREIGEAEIRRTQVRAGPTVRQLEAVRSLEEEMRQLDGTLSGLEAQRDEMSRKLREAGTRRDEAVERELEMEGKYGDMAGTAHAAKAAEARAQADMALVDRVPKGMQPEDYARLQMLRAKHGVHVAANLARGRKHGPPAASRPVPPPA